MKLSDYVIQTFIEMGIDSAFSVTGGASMHLNDSAGQNPLLNVMYMHNEQSCAMAAEGYARIKKKPALVIVTAGPGAINAINGVFGAYTDSIPMVVISGQARKNTQKNSFGLEALRQLGDQEAPILDMVSKITKKTYEILETMSGSAICDLLVDAYTTSNSGRPGPVWIEIPVDVQSINIEPSEISLSQRERGVGHSEDIRRSLSIIMEKLMNSRKPVLLLGSGTAISNTSAHAISFAEEFDIPVLTAWSHDVITSDHRLFFGRPGTIGTRPGNMIIQNCDLLIVLGSRLNIRQISYNYEGFAPHAFIVQVDVDALELIKPFPRVDLGIECELQDFFGHLNTWEKPVMPINHHANWLLWCAKVRDKYKVKDNDYPTKLDSINAYHLIPDLIRRADKNTTFVCGDATACIVPFQTAHLIDGMRMFSNSGCASMGYDLPAALGAAFADSKRKVICFAGDGSVMMNLQELQTLASSGLDIMLIILNNGGYLSIKQTQSNFFGRFHGSTPDSGVTFPDFAKVCRSFDLPTQELDSGKWRDQLDDFLSLTVPRVLVANIDRDQEFEPRIKSKILNGSIQTPSLEDMYPHLDPVELLAIMEEVNT